MCGLLVALLTLANGLPSLSEMPFLDDNPPLSVSCSLHVKFSVFFLKKCFFLCFSLLVTYWNSVSTPFESLRH